MIEQYGYCIMDGRRERLGNFRIEPPGLFRGRGDHPKMGCLKQRVRPEDIVINTGPHDPPPPPPEGHRWQAVVHNDRVLWVAAWLDNVTGSNKYVQLSALSSMKGENDRRKYEKARQLKGRIDRIREHYTLDMRDKLMAVRQRATAVYLIDKLALRCGNEKDTDEEADTVGCCSLRFEHIQLEEPNTIHFDFLGKDSIRYVNAVAVDSQAFKNFRIFLRDKEPGDLLFDRLSTSMLNKHLQGFMEGLTAKVFRTFNASYTLQEQLVNTPANGSVDEKMHAYNAANRAVAILCNHQRSVPKKHNELMSKLDERIKHVKSQLRDAKAELKQVPKEDQSKRLVKKRKVQRLSEQLHRLCIQRNDRDENKTVALSTSKLNYLDPRITVAWCRRHNVPIERVYNKTQRAKFAWAMDTPPDWRF